MSISKYFCIYHVYLYNGEWMRMIDKGFPEIYVFPQCAELAERLEEGDIFPPVEEIVCPLLFGAALHIQVTIIMVRCVFCHLGDFLSNWVAWSLCLSMDYSLAYCALFCTAFPVSYYNLLSSCVVMVGQFSYSILLHVTISSTLVILNV